jgi:signal recognition particle subunit SRP68
MDITTFVSSRRQTLLISDYATYRSQLSRQILSTRKRLRIATPRREKFTPRPVTAENVGDTREYAYLMLLMAERAWAHGMLIKSQRNEDAGGITGSGRSHVISRLDKAAKVARQLLELLKEQSVSKATDQDVLEGKAYAALMSGAEEFERQSGGKRDGKGWEECLKLYSEARVIYAAFYEKEKKEVFREFLANTIDPTIRYAAYQASLSRTIAIPTVAKRYFPQDDAGLVRLVEQLDPYALKDKPQPKTDDEKQSVPTLDAPTTITWRNRKANIIDASIGQALASVNAAEAQLRKFLAENAEASNKDKAAAYDDILVASQDASDAAQRATDELKKEKVDEGEQRMQDLRVTSLAVNYGLVSWRVGRNRTLIGSNDGMPFVRQPQKQPKRLKKDGTEYPEKPESRSHILARLRESVVLLDASIQSINSVKDLPGALRDATFVSELDSKVIYFRALKCLHLAFAHHMLDQRVNVLALLKRAQDLLDAQTPTLSPSADEANAPATLEIAPSTYDDLKSRISDLQAKTHARVELDSLSTPSTTPQAGAQPLVNNLNAYPSPGQKVDLTNLVTYPPKIEPVPVKPLFLDVAWNYIEYPGRKAEGKRVVAKAEEMVKPVVNGVKDESKEPEKKRGWFGFGR